jgi:16S rRNA (cytidine1402-2'-O)-methyltransferase
MARGGSGSGPARPRAVEPGVLYVVATPIGNLEDITLRALRVLREADIVAAEDTRHAAILLRAHGIERPLTSYHEHNEAARSAQLLDHLRSGRSVAVVSDAGTPGVSDPGYRIVRAAIGAGMEVIAIPGASAVITAIVTAGFPSAEFLSLGFLPPRGSARRRAIERIEREAGCVVFFESPRRLARTLADLAERQGERPAAVLREMTKLYEEVRRGTVASLKAVYDAEPPRGEVVVVVGPPKAPGFEIRLSTAALAERDRLIAAGMSEEDATERAAAIYGAGRRRKEGP